MSSLSVTLIDVVWGDSILIESQDDSGQSYYALIDSNDTTYLRSSYIFLKRFFEKKKIELANAFKKEGIPYQMLFWCAFSTFALR